MKQFERETGISTAQLIRAANARSLEILEHVAGIPPNVLTDYPGTCPVCGNECSFILTVTDAGHETVFCVKCFRLEHADLVKVVCHFRGVDRLQALRLIAGYLFRVKAPMQFSTKITWTYTHDFLPTYSIVMKERTVKGKREQRFIRHCPNPRWYWLTYMHYIRLFPLNLKAIKERVDEPLYFAAGEQCCDAVTSLGLLATTVSGGHKTMFRGCGACNECGEMLFHKHSKYEKPLFSMENKNSTTTLFGCYNCQEYWGQYVKNRHVIVIPDKDKPGAEYAQRVAFLLKRVDCTVKIVELPDLQAGEDVADWVNRGGTKDELLQIAEATPLFKNYGYYQMPGNRTIK